MFSLVVLVSRFITAWFAYLLPAYNTYKTLAHRAAPGAQAELERLSMYWCVMGALTALEVTAEWTYSWFPFYFELKTLFLLFLSLPQTQGSTWVYQTYAAPLLAQREADIDGALAAAQTQTVAFAQHRLAVAWDALVTLLNRSARAASGSAPASPGAAQPATPGGTQPPPPAAGWAESARGLWSAYGPAVVGAVNRYRGAAPDAAGASSGYEAHAAAPPQPRRSPMPSPGIATPSSYSDAAPPFPTPQFN